MDTVLCNDDGVLIYTGAPSATDEILAFHYGNFDDAYGDGTVDDAAANGRVYANTDPGDLPTKFGIITVVGTASGQTTYTWTPPATSLQANVLVVAGGGGGGGRSGGGGGAGGLIYQPNQTLNSASYTIVVGQGGTGGAGTGTFGTNGKNSTGFGVTAIGGGGGASDPGAGTGLAGGSGGGGRYGGGGGTGTTGQGNNGGGSTGASTYNGGGGGGGGSIGETGTTTKIGDGGAGFLVGVFGETYGESGWFAGGGGGGSHNPWPGSASLGGIGGGGAGGTNAGGGTPGEDGDAHTGGGGGAGSTDSSTGGAGGSGGSGVVLVRYIVDTTVIVSNYVVNRGLAVLLDAADTASYSGTGTTWTDISGNGRNGTLQGSVSWVDQGSASYFDFSGANADYINQTAGTSQIYKDICIVFQLEDDDWNYLLANSTTSDRALRIIGSSLRIPGSSGDWTQTGTTYYVNGIATTTAVPLPQNQWHILGGENKNATLTGSAWNYHLGTGYSGRSLNGKIAFLALYTEPLTAAEHIHNYNALKHRFGV